MEFYRYTAHNSQPYGYDVNGEIVFNNIALPNVTLQINVYNLHKETPKGYWIGYGECKEGKLRGKSTWVSKTSKKRYAYPTKELALNNFIKRSEYRVKILRKQLEITLAGIYEAKKLQE